MVQQIVLKGNQMQSPDLWVVIPTYNRSSDLISCLESLLNADIDEANIIIVDNHSQDDTVTQVNINYPNTHLIKLSKNKGATGASNIGFDYALRHGANLILRLDSDTVVAPDFLAPLVQRAINDPRIGIVGPKVYYFDSPDEIWYAGVNAHPWHFGGIQDFRHDKDSPATCYPREVDYVWGAAMLIKSEVFQKTKGFDNQFFIYFEEVDLCKRTQKLGYKIIFESGSHIWHKVGSTVHNKWTAFHWNRSKILLYRKHSRNFFHYILLICYALTYALFSSLFVGKSRNRGPIGATLKGIWSGLTTSILRG